MAMVRYLVEVEEYLCRQIYVDADDSDEAYDIVCKRYKDSEIVLNADDYIQTEINVLRQIENTSM